jgi:hypothetical protein
VVHTEPPGFKGLIPVINSDTISKILVDALRNMHIHPYEHYHIYSYPVVSMSRDNVTYA